MRQKQKDMRKTKYNIYTKYQYSYILSEFPILTKDISMTLYLKYLKLIYGQ